MKQNLIWQEILSDWAHTYRSFRPIPCCFTPPDKWRRNTVWDLILNWCWAKTTCYCEEFIDLVWNLLKCLQTQTKSILLPSPRLTSVRHWWRKCVLYIFRLIYPSALFFSLYSIINIITNCCITVSMLVPCVVYDVPLCLNLVVCACLR